MRDFVNMYVIPRKNKRLILDFVCLFVFVCVFVFVHVCVSVFVHVQICTCVYIQVLM